MSEHPILDLWARQPGDWCCLSTKSVEGRWRDYFFDPDDCDLTNFIARHRDENIFFCPHLFDARRRIKDHAVLPKLLWADLDAVDPRRIVYRPTVAIRSSPRRYVGLWRTDRTVTEELNRRLTYALGADASGWDLGQVLRLPGSINHKPQYSKPRVRLLWDDGPRYRVDDLETKLPRLTPIKVPERGDRRASLLTLQQIIDKHQLNGNLRRELLGPGRPTKLDGQRGYKVHWRLACELREAGVPGEEAFICLRDTKWNKHADDRSVWALVEKVFRNEGSR